MNKNVFALLSSTLFIATNILTSVSAQVRLAWGIPSASVIGRSLEDGVVKKGHYIYSFDLNKKLGKFLCYSTGKIINPVEKLDCPVQSKLIKYDKHLSRCIPRKTVPFYRPYGIVLIEKPSVISWGSVPDTKDYTVIVDGFKERKIIKNIKGYSVPFPSDIPFDNEHSVYSIIVIAETNQDKSSTDREESIHSNVAINYSRNSEYLSEYLNTVKQVNSLKIPKETLLLTDLASIYSNAHLFEEITPKVEELAVKHKNSVFVLLTLADLYLKGHQPYLAVEKYYKALEIAKQQNLSLEAKRIDEQLNYLYQVDKDLKSFALTTLFPAMSQELLITSINIPSYHC